MKLLISALTLLFLLSSCQSQGPSAPVPPHPVIVQMTGPTRAIFAQQGDFRVAAFDVWIRETNGRPAAGIPATLFVRRGPGEIIPSNTYSDSQGRIRALFAVFAPAQDEVVQLAVSVYEDTTLCSIKIPAGPVPPVNEIAPGMVPALQKLLDDMIGNGKSGK